MPDTSRLPLPRAEHWEWQRHAACRGEASAVFFSPNGERGENRAQREAHAKAFCAICPVAQTCLDHALATREPYGVWGGLSETERAALLHHQPTTDTEPGPTVPALSPVSPGPQAQHQRADRPPPGPAGGHHAGAAAGRSLPGP